MRHRAEKMKSQSQMIFLLFIGYVVVYIDKTVTGFALLPIEKEFGLNAEQLGYITGIFFSPIRCFRCRRAGLTIALATKRCWCCR